ncbi:Rid family hydrolase [Falsiroseomonas oryzae]|uniref:Rid family hydrolase n=1 Tax=Falsiroseomonas oryzae TaxID=2766473 RepID=UPI0022EB396A|nr:Rid family hydrolase [Roseomonas sp. MO-31]
MRPLPIIALIPGVAPHGATAEVRRHGLLGADVSAALAVEVPASASILHFSGVVAPMLPDGSYADTHAQTRAALHELDTRMRRLGLDFEDLVRVQVLLVGDPALDGRMDMAGFDAAWAEFFGTLAQPTLPARSVAQVLALSAPGCLVELLATAARARR